MAATLRGRDTVRVESPRDLPEALAPCVVAENVTDDFGRKASPPGGAQRWPLRPPRLLLSLGEVALELCDRDQS